MEPRKCALCGSVQPASPQPRPCVQCGTPAPSRGSLSSYSEVLDTKSFITPVRKKVIWIWAAVGVGVSLLMTAVWLLVRLLQR
jgi:uncharacterized membrane protein YvbJ